MQIDIAIADGVSGDQQHLQDLVQQAVVEATRVAGLEVPEGGELSVLLADDDMLQKLNSEWRAKDKPTNVLSFPSSDIIPGEVPEAMLGDIAISLATTRREAELEKKSFDHHFTHLVVHGYLHLFGYDHETDEEAETMEALETRILDSLGIADPYQT